MNKYRVAIARVETKVYHFEIEADSEEAAKYEAWEAWEDGEDFGEGECVHADEWLQDTEVLNEVRPLLFLPRNIEKVLAFWPLVRGSWSRNRGRARARAGLLVKL
jgi:hypothetical protein